MASCALRHHVGLLCHLPSWTLVSSWASKPSCALRHLIPSDLLQPDALSRRWDVYPKGGISESFGTADGLILSSPTCISLTPFSPILYICPLPCRIRLCRSFPCPLHYLISLRLASPFCPPRCPTLSQIFRATSSVPLAFLWIIAPLQNSPCPLSTNHVLPKFIHGTLSPLRCFLQISDACPIQATHSSAAAAVIVLGQLVLCWNTFGSYRRRRRPISNLPRLLVDAAGIHPSLYTQIHH